MFFLSPSIPLPGPMVLAGVIGDCSSIEPPMDKFFCRKLVDERFFLMVVGGGIILVNLAGDDGAAAVSSMLLRDPPWVRAGVAGDSLARDSFE